MDIYKPKTLKALFLILFLGITAGLALTNGLHLTQASVATPPTGSWQCWDDGSQDPCHNFLRAVDVIDNGHAWAVGGGGRISRWDGFSWSDVPSPTQEHLHNIDMLSPIEGWAVGQNGTLLHWDGGTWAQVASPTTAHLEDVAMVSPFDVWAVGSRRNSTAGTILHWNGTSWSVVDSPPSPTNYNLRAISMVDFADGWAVGTRDNDGGNIIIHWNGLEWTEFTDVNSTAWLFDIQMVSDSAGWAVGSNNTILYWNGLSWRRYTLPLPPIGGYIFTSVEMINAEYGWIVGDDGNILQYANNSWDPVLVPPELENSNFSSVSGTATSVLVTGNALAHWNGIDWQSLSSPPLIDDLLNSIDMISETDGWAVGGDFLAGGAGTYHWDGITWEEISNPYDDQQYRELLAVDMVTADYGWAVGYSGTILNWDGTQWTDVPKPVNIWFLRDVSAPTVDDAWAVGNTGEIIHWQGSQWITVTNPVTTPLTAIDMISPTEGWAVGEEMIHWDGNSWTVYDNPIDYVRDVHMLSSTDGWAVGSIYGTGSAILHWNGSQWAVVKNPVTTVLTAIHMVSPEEGWAVGTNVILYWDGSEWTEVESPVNTNFSGVSMISSSDGWISSTGGVLLRYGESGFFFEGFDQDTLAPNWSWVRENPENWNLDERPGYLRIHTQSDTLQETINAENILLRSAPDSSYALSARIEINPTEDYHAAQVLLYEDDDNYIQLARLYDSNQATPNQVRLLYERDGEIIETISVPTSQQVIELRLTVDNQTVMAAYENDENQWVTFGTLAVDGLSAYSSIGLAAHNSIPATSIPADFDFIQVEPVTILRVYLPITLRP